MVTKRVEVLPYNELWKHAFNKELEELYQIFDSNNVIFHHIGSTSIEGLCAKPVIDILAGADDLDLLDFHTNQLVEKGYMAKGEYGIPGRRYFSKPKNEHGDFAVHLHAFQKGSHEITRHLAFRDYLRAHPGLAEEYGKVKTQAAKMFPTDIQSYMKEKDPFIKEFERRALVWVTK